MKRRSFLKLSGATAFAAATQARARNSGEAMNPNVLIVMTDQQFADAMSCVMGNEYISTPNLDALAKSGTRFTRAYTPNPLCLPMRTSMITGQYPHRTGVVNNAAEPIDPDQFSFLGKLFQDAGYETAYFGKWHVAFDKDRKDVHGFDVFMEKEARLDPEPAARFLRKNHERPFLAVASFLGPHEICQWARKEKLPGEQLGDPPPLGERPPMKTNSDPPANETDIMTHMRKSFQAHRLFPVGDYTEADWRRLSWGYYRLIERVDRFIGTVLAALKASGKEKDTVVLFLSDHGECHGAHRWNQKTVFYDESTRVPFILQWRGKILSGTSRVLVNTGIDVLPTLCDLAGIHLPSDLPGKSLKAQAMGLEPDWKRDYVVCQNHMVQCEPVDGKFVQPHGRMVRSARYKYCLYSEGDRRESLVDMDEDPGEMRNQANHPAFKDILKRHRGYLREHAVQHRDRLAIEMLRCVDTELAQSNNG